MPTHLAGDNKIALVNIRDLCSIIRSLLSLNHPDGSLELFPKAYVLAVDGDTAQPTLKEAVVAIGKAFGGTGETRPMALAELEDMLVDDQAALSLLPNMRFSNEGGLVMDMVAKGASRGLKVVK